MVERLIKIGVNLNAAGSRFGGSALDAAIIRHHMGVVKLLLDAGADPSQADFNRATPLHTAVVVERLRCSNAAGIWSF
jgi:ankyrin repeat protein